MSKDSYFYVKLLYSIELILFCLNGSKNEVQKSRVSLDQKSQSAEFCSCYYFVSDFQSLTLHLKVSLLTRGSINNSVISGALSSVSINSLLICITHCQNHKVICS